MLPRHANFFVFFFNDTATTEIYTPSLHDALPILEIVGLGARPACVFVRGVVALIDFDQRLHGRVVVAIVAALPRRQRMQQDRKSTRLNSSHLVISYAVFCLKKKKNSPSTTSPD